jgi:hypothetical protein
MPSPEKTPERMEGAIRGGGSEPALLFRLSASWLGVWTADGYKKLIYFKNFLKKILEFRDNALE